MVDKRFDFSTLDIEYEKLLARDGLNEGCPRATNIIDITINCEYNDSFHLQFAKFLDGLVKEALETLESLHKKKIRNNFKGKFTNFTSWNFLNPFGEIISLLTILKSNNYSLLEIEHEISRRKSIDFLLEANNGRKIAVEVINIHPKFQYKDITELENHLVGKIKTKIEEKTKNIQFDTLEFNSWTYLPVLWSTDLEGLLSYKEFFVRFQTTPITVQDKQIFPLGFTSFIQHIDETTGKRSFEYGLVTKLFEKIR